VLECEGGFALLVLLVDGEVVPGVVALDEAELLLLCDEPPQAPSATSSRGSTNVASKRLLMTDVTGG
jgi:hypothetical protein